MKKAIAQPLTIMKNLCLFLLFCIACCGTAFSQLDTFDLSSYPLTDLVRHQLDVRPQFGSSGTWNRENNSGPGLQQDFETNVAGELAAEYSFFRNTRRVQIATFVAVNAAPNFQSREAQSNANFSRGDWTVGVAHEQRWYDKRKRFIEVGLSAAAALAHHRTNNAGNSNESQRSKVSFNAPILIGKGRLERVDDARMALFILNELLNEKRIGRVPTELEILDFAALISRIRNQRFFDARHKRIYELEMIDDFLTNRGLITETDARYFTTINDNWGFAINPYREVGSRFSIGIVPEWRQLVNRNQVITQGQLDRETRFTYENYCLSGMMEFISSRAYSLYWQGTFSTQVNFYNGCEAILNGTNPDTVRDTRLSMQVEYGLDWHPTSRTIFRSKAFTHVRLFRNRPDPGEVEVSAWNVWAGINGDLSYYLSPRVRLGVNGMVTYAFDRSESQFTPTSPVSFNSNQGIGYQLDAGLLYSFM